MDNMTRLGQLGGTVDSIGRVNGVVIGVLCGFAQDQAPLVDFPGNRRDDPVACRTSVALGTADIGREVALLFEDGDPTKPLLIGAIVQPDRRAPSSVVVQHDGERVEITAQRQIVLRCGAASITLTRAGKILIRGAYLSSRSSGVNRIKGGAVQIN